MNNHQRAIEHKPMPGPPRFSVPGLSATRRCACGGIAAPGGECAACRARRLATRQAGSGPAAAGAAPAIVHEVLREPGQALDGATRRYMEPLFGHDFSQVRVHADARAAESARAVNALAFTVGRSVVFGAGQYAPGTSAGQRLLAHELTHVAQQRDAPLQEPLIVGSPDDMHEQEARHAAEQVTSEPGTRPAGSAARAPLPAGRAGSRVLRRQPADAPEAAPGSTTVDGEPPCAAPRDLACQASCAPGPLEGAQKDLRFGLSSSSLTADQRKEIDAFVEAGRAAGGAQTFQVDGYSSVDGPADLNWRLSCARAQAVAAEVTAAGATPVVVARGPSTQFSPTSADANRHATLTASTPQPVCADDPTVSPDQDALPPVPPFKFTRMSAPEVLAKVRELQPPGHPIPAKPPLGISQPRFQTGPVRVSAVPVPEGDCVKCVAHWDLVAEFQAFVATGSFSDEPRRFAAIREGDASGCPPTAIPRLLEVRKVILPEAERLSVIAEREHYDDFVRAFRIVGGRYLANVRRLTPERTPLRAKSAGECPDRVEAFLIQLAGLPGDYSEFLRERIGTTFLEVYHGQFQGEFIEMYLSSKRDEGPHLATPTPPPDRPPFFPNIDLDKNPFGCQAFWRKFDARSGPGIPGGSAEDLIKDTNAPPKHAWHVM